MSQSVCVLSLIKNEHDFVNPWIEYYLTLGVNHFYLIIDNSTFTQEPYIINDSFKDKVTFFYVEKEKEKEVNSSGFIHLKINNFIKYVKEDWIFLAPPDQYYYNNGKTIVELVNSVRKDCGQVAIPWKFVLNLDDVNYDNFMENINEYKFIAHTHTSPLARTKDIDYLSSDSHYFKLKNNNIILLEDEYFNFSEGNSFTIFNRLYKKHIKYSNISQFKNGFHLHFHIRNIDEIIVKDFFSWNAFNNLDKSINIFRNLINFSEYKCNIYGESNRLSLLFNHAKNCDFNLKLPKLKCKNKNNLYNKYIKILLDKANLTDEDYLKWKQNIVYYKKYNIVYNDLKYIPIDFDLNLYIKNNKFLGMNEIESLMIFINSKKNN